MVGLEISNIIEEFVIFGVNRSIIFFIIHCQNVNIYTKLQTEKHIIQLIKCLNHTENVFDLSFYDC